MADNERQTEIERTECAICGKAGYWAHRFDADHPAHSYKPVQRRYVRLDRVRDARGDDEAPATTFQDSLAAACGTEADGPARSPQGEDHNG